VAARAGSEDFENQTRAVQHFNAQVALEIALLGR